MTKARKGIMWSLIAVLAALLVALAVVGVTFARYSSEGEGSGSASVATWNINITDNTNSSGGGQVTVDSFSPKAEAYEPGGYCSESARVNKSDLILIATLTNAGAVSADVTVSQGEGITYVFDTSACLGCVAEDGSWNCDDNCTCDDEPCEDGCCDFCYGYTTLGYGADLDNHFQVVLYSGACAEGNDATSLTEETTSTTLSSEETLYIFAEIDWISDTESCYGTAADAFDTWCGHYLSALRFEITYSAVQASDEE